MASVIVGWLLYFFDVLKVLGVCMMKSRIKYKKELDQIIRPAPLNILKNY